MLTIERGTGDPLVFIPGLQGRWEYMRPAIDALAQSHRVISFPLCDEPSSGATFQPQRGLDNYVDQVDAVLDGCNLERAVICGISFGGLVALRFAATRPDRSAALVLASTPGPQFHLKRRHRLYARLPWLFGPVFAAESPSRVRAEVKAALPGGSDRRRFMRQQMLTFREAPLSVSRMAARAHLIESYERTSDCARVTCPTLIVHGDPQLDFVVNAYGTATYGELIAGARVALIEKTGHLGSITMPDRFAAIVSDFLKATGKESQHSAA
jgi:pimeloyl-ACP methyl ester carboxylesterase